MNELFNEIEECLKKYNRQTKDTGKNNFKPLFEEIENIIEIYFTNN